MKKILLAFLLLALGAIPASAQVMSNVIGTVIDPNGLPWAGGTVKAQLLLAGAGLTGQPTGTQGNPALCASGGFGSAPCQVPIMGTVGPVTIKPDGSFLIALPQNNFITPAGTQWVLTYNQSPGVPPPLGTGPQTFTTNSSVNSNPTFTVVVAPVPALLNNISTLFAPLGGTLLLTSNGQSPGLQISNGSSTLFSVTTSFGTWNFINIGAGGAGTGAFTTLTASTLNTTTNCAVNSASPAACGSAAAGAVVVPTTTTTYTVNTTRVTADSRIFLFPMSFAGNLPSAPTCVAPATTSVATISAITAATSFTFALPSTTGQTCWEYLIFN
jgi:hypothetical protein